MNYNLGRVAIIADQMTDFGGADREMFSVLKLFPDADIYTVLYNPSKYSHINIKNKVYTSFAQKLPFKYKMSRHLKILNPIAYENFNFEKYDTLISISAGPARNIIPGIYQKHIAMVMTPPRSLWDHELNVRSSRLKNIYKPISKIINNYQRILDVSTTPRVDYWIANSKFISRKIKKRYGVESTVIYPGISKENFREISQEEVNDVLQKYQLPDKFFLSVSRLYDYKHVDWAIESCVKTNKNLVIVGNGPDSKYLKEISKNHSNIIFLGFLDDDKDVQVLYKQALALLFCGIEDFGLVPVEAMAQGTPIIAYNKGGVTETVLEEKTGEFFNNQEELTNILNHFDKSMYNPTTIKNRAKDFTEKKFLQNLENYLSQIYE
ncbi:MAG: glycosyltransferase [Candidatus Dojkabacteria bacterium]|nr:glycosyltransferase [Candidatus Dojkabacteria bacterium]